MTTLEITATEDETLLDLPPGDVELQTPHPVVFWCASPDPSVRAKDYRTELQRLHAGAPITIGSVPEGWKLAISLRPDLPAMYRERPKPEPVAPPPGPTEEELAERALARQIAKDMERAEIVNEAFDLVMRKLSVQAAPEPELAPEHHFADLMLADETIDDARARLSQRLKELRHYLIAPEIKVNDDGSVGLTAGEQAELQDLERRQTLGRWLEA